MSIISFSRHSLKIFPEEVEGYPVDPRFRNIMRIMRILHDEKKSVRQRVAYSLRYFYTEDIPEENAVGLMELFIRGDNEKENDDEPQQMDIEFDADEIYSDFLREYRIDLLKEDMHWYRFLVLLRGLSSDSALSNKIYIRFMDTSKLKGKERSKAEKAKKCVQLPQYMTMEEMQEAEKFKSEWGNMGL